MSTELNFARCSASELVLFIASTKTRDALEHLELLKILLDANIEELGRHLK